MSEVPLYGQPKPLHGSGKSTCGRALIVEKGFKCQKGLQVPKRASNAKKGFKCRKGLKASKRDKSVKTGYGSGRFNPHPNPYPKSTKSATSHQV